MTYDQWKTREPGYYRPLSCEFCEDAGCPDCCECEPATLEDMDARCGEWRARQGEGAK